MSNIDNKQLTTLLALCDGYNVVNPVGEAFENIMLLQEPVTRQDEIHELKEKIAKARKTLPVRAVGGQSVLKKRKILNFEDLLQKLQDEFLAKRSFSIPGVPWQEMIKKFVRENFGMQTKAQTAFFVELAIRGRQN